MAFHPTAPAGLGLWSLTGTAPWHKRLQGAGSVAAGKVRQGLYHHQLPHTPQHQRRQALSMTFGHQQMSIRRLRNNCLSRKADTPVSYCLLSCQTVLSLVRRGEYAHRKVPIRMGHRLQTEPDKPIRSLGAPQDAHCAHSHLQMGVHCTVLSPEPRSGWQCLANSTGPTGEGLRGQGPDLDRSPPLAAGEDADKVLAAVLANSKSRALLPFSKTD